MNDRIKHFQHFTEKYTTAKTIKDTVLNQSLASSLLNLWGIDLWRRGLLLVLLKLTCALEVVLQVEDILHLF